jgi:4-hydroxy-tetrahydrodipicolinate synthase
MTGRDTLIFYGLMAGARGSVPATGNIAPALLVEIYERFRAGDLAGSKAAQDRLSPLRLALTLCTVPAGLKAAMRLIGLPIGPCRSPVSDLPAEKEPQMRAALRTAGLLPAAQ